MIEPSLEPGAQPVADPVVLVADNDAAVNSMLTAILTDAGYVCESVFDGEQALARLCEGGIGVLITDLDMPKLDGRELLARLPKVANPPDTLVISGYLDPQVQTELEAEPAVRRVLRKPFDVVEFAELVGVLVRRRRSVASISPEQISPE